MSPYSKNQTLSTWILYIIIGINIAVWLALQTDYGVILLSEGAKVNSCIEQGQYWRLLTAGFLHQNILHIFLNMYSLYAVWNFLKDYFRAIPLTLVYLGAIVTGSICSYYFNTSVSIGASGGVFGLIGAALVFAVFEKESKLVQNLLQIIAINVAIGIINLNYIDNWAHLGGFLGGSILAVFFLQTTTSKRVS